MLHFYFCLNKYYLYQWLNYKTIYVYIYLLMWFLFLFFLSLCKSIFPSFIIFLLLKGLLLTCLLVWVSAISSLSVCMFESSFILFLKTCLLRYNLYTTNFIQSVYNLMVFRCSQSCAAMIYVQNIFITPKGDISSHSHCSFLPALNPEIIVWKRFHLPAATGHRCTKLTRIRFLLKSF